MSDGTREDAMWPERFQRDASGEHAAPRAPSTVLRRPERGRAPSELGPSRRAGSLRAECEIGSVSGSLVHVAQSHFHDIVPADELGIRSVWINRLGEQREPAPTRELPSLEGLADVLDELVR